MCMCPVYPNDPEPTPELIYDYNLYLIDDQLMESEKRLSDYEDMPQPSLEEWGQITDDFLLHEQLNHDREALANTHRDIQF